jgi:RHS repeat-associated protein
MKRNFNWLQKCLSLVTIFSLLISEAPLAARSIAGEPLSLAAASAPEDAVHTSRLEPLPSRSALAGEALSCGPHLWVHSGSGALLARGVGLSLPGDGPSLQAMLDYHSLYRQRDDGWGYGWSLDRDWRYQTDPNGNVTIRLGRADLLFTSDGQGGFIAPSSGITLTQQVDEFILTWASGEQLFFASPAHQRATRWEDPDDWALTFSYDTGGRLIALMDDHGRRLTLAYAGGRLSTIAAPKLIPARQLQLSYNPAGDLIAFTDAEGHTTHLAYDPQHRLTLLTDPRGAATEIVYEGDYVTSVVAGGVTTAFSMDESKGEIVIQQRDSQGNTRQHAYLYDSFGRLAKVTYPDGAYTTQTWDEVQRQFRTADENGHTTTLTFAEADQTLQSIRDPLGGVTRFAYSPADGTLAGTTDPNGQTLAYRYDADGRIIAAVDPLDQRNSFQYDATGRVMAITDPLSHTTRLAYDAIGYMTVITTSLGSTARLLYDPAGNLIVQTDGNGLSTGFAYDALGRTTAITNALGAAISFVYDGNGNPIQTVDPQGNPTRVAYDDLDRPAVITDALGGETWLAYDAWGDLLTLTDASQHTTHYRYDDRDRLIAETDPLSQTISYQYDAAGNLISMTNARGQVLTYTYDAADQLTRLDLPGNDDVYLFYDPAGQLVAVGDGNLDTGYTYDGAGRLTETIYSYSGVSFAPLPLTYAYNAAGLPASVTLPDGEVLSYEYDPDQRLVAIVGGGTRFELTYDPGGRLLSIAPAAGQPGVHTSLGYDDADQITALSNLSPDGAVTFDAFSYTYSPAGNLLAAAQNGQTTTYVYDALHRLTEVNYPDGSWERYTYDAAGNRLSLETPDGTVSYVYDAADQLTSLTDTHGGSPQTTTFTYDADGNLRTRITQGATTTYSWDAASRLVRIDYPDGTYLAYTYGPQGQRLARRDRSGQVIYYVYDGLNLVEERDAAGNLRASYVYGDRLDRPFSLRRDGQIYYYLYDRLGSVIGLTDGAGLLVNRYAYDPWGNIRSQSEAVPQPFRYTGRTWDAAAGLYHNRARDYDPALGRFISRDPLGPVDGPNRYIYVSNNPLAYVDPLGTQQCEDDEDCKGYCECFNECFARQTKGNLKTNLDYVDSLLSLTSNVRNLHTKFWKERAKLKDRLIFQSGLKPGHPNVLFPVNPNAWKDFPADFAQLDQKLARQPVDFYAKRIFDDLKYTRKVLISLDAYGVNNPCGAMTEMLSVELVDKSWSAVDGVKDSLALCGAAPATGWGAAFCVYGAARLTVALSRLAIIGRAALTCVEEAQKCKGDREDPQVGVTETACDRYQVTASDDCELVVDPSGVYAAQPETRFADARDKAGNLGFGIIPACKESCYLPPAECQKCEFPMWKQESCQYQCVHLASFDPIPCEPPQQLKWNQDTCSWECKCPPPPPPPSCGKNKCGQSLSPVYDNKTCSWKCQGSTNNPCNPDDNRSPAGLALPSVGEPGVALQPPASQAVAAVPISLELLEFFGWAWHGPPLPAEGAQSTQPAGVLAAASSASGPARLAILDNGFSISLQDFLARLDIAADRVAADFSPEMVARYPALFIPSGGLSGYQDSVLMRQRLAQYAQNGGVIVAFTQEYGAEFGLLPGGELRGYGYDEDLNCHSDSAYIVAFAPPLLGQHRDLLSLNVDGFFTAWPQETSVLLGRVANGMPAMLTYPYGAGRVIVATSYADMADYQGQGTPEEQILLRDLARWALAPDLSVDEYGPADLVAAAITLTNQSAAPLDRLDYDWLDPWGHPAASGSLTLTVPLDPGDSTHITLTLDLAALALPEKDRYGLWSLDGVLTNAAGDPAQPLPDLYRFAVTSFTGQAGGHSYRGQPYALSVTSATEEYFHGESAVFTYHIFNHSDQAETFRVSWYLIHHSWYNVPGYQGDQTLTVPPHSTGVLTSTLDRVVDLDRVRARLYLDGQQVAYAERGFWAVQPYLEQSIYAGQGAYAWGDSPVITLTTTNPMQMPVQVTTTLQAWSPEGQGILTETLALSLMAGATYIYTTTLPALEQGGYYTARAQSWLEGREIARAETSLYLAPPAAQITVGLPDRFATGLPLTATVQNVSAYPLLATALQVSLLDPAGAPLWSEQVVLPALSPGQQVSPTLTLGDPGLIGLGEYHLNAQVLLANRSIAQFDAPLPARAILEGEFSQSAYHIRDTLWLTATLRNDGYFDLTPQVVIAAPALGLALTQTVSLPVGAQAVVPISATLPTSLAAAAYPIQITMAQGSGISQSYTFVIPPAHLDADLLPGVYIAGGALPATVQNSGGVDAVLSYSMTLQDGRALLADTVGVITIPAGGEAALALLVPDQAALGNYPLRIEGRDQPSGQTYTWGWPVALEGVAASVDAHAERPAYLAGEAITVTGQISETSGGPFSATLELNIIAQNPTNITVQPDEPVGLFSVWETPNIAMTPAGNAWAIWDRESAGGDQTYIYAAPRAFGGNWGTEERVDDWTYPDWKYEPAIALDAAGNAYAVWSDYGKIYFAERPAGDTWGPSALISDYAYNHKHYPDVAVDAAGNVYVVWEDNRNGYDNYDIYFTYRPAGGSWQPNVRVNDDVGTSYQYAPAIAVDTAGNAYAVWDDRRNGTYNGDIYFAYRPAGGAWGANVRVDDDPSASGQYWPDIAIDAAGTAYVVWEDYRPASSSDIHFSYRLANGAWSPSVRVNDDGEGNYNGWPNIALDEAGNAYAVWEDTRDNGNEDIYFSYRPAGGEWSTNLRLNNDPINDREQFYPTIAAGPPGYAYAVWLDDRNYDPWEHYDVYGAAIQVGDSAWRRTLTATVSTTWSFAELVDTLAGQTGKFYLQATLRNALGQTLDTSLSSFYIHPNGAALTLETDQAAYRPGQTVQVSGCLTNTAALTATLPLTVTAGDQTLLTQTFVLAPGEGAPYAASFTATSDVALTAQAGAAEVGETVSVAAPHIETALFAPSVAGQAPFSVTLAVTNTSPYPLTFSADFAGQVSQTLTLEPQATAWLPASLAISADTLLRVTLSGDVTATLIQTVAYGEAATLALGDPGAAVWAGPVGLPYTLTNTGLLPWTIPLAFNLDDESEFTHSVTTLPGQVYTDVLELTLSPGAHVLTATLPGQQSTTMLTAYTPGAPVVQITGLQTPAQLVGSAPLTVTLTNPSPGPVDGELRAATSFDLAWAPFHLEGGETRTLTATLDGNLAPAGGVYTLTVAAWVNGLVIASLAQPLEVPQPAWRVGLPPLTLVPGTTFTLPVTVSNQGGLGAAFDLTLDLHGLYAAEQNGWAEPGETVVISYALALPADIEARTGLGHYTLNGAQTPFTYTIAGYQLDMAAQLSSPVAAAGEPVTVTIQVTDTADLGGAIPLVVRLVGVGEPQTAAITLTNTASIDFAIRAPAQSALLSYGIYHPDGRSLLLDTLRLYTLGEPISFYPARERYFPGETVELVALAQITGTLSWQAFGISQTLSLSPGAPVSLFAPLAGDLTEDTYRAWYLFRVDEWQWYQGEAAFEVVGDQVAVRQVILHRELSAPQETISATLRVESQTALSGVTLSGQVLAPDGAALAIGSVTLDLVAGSQWVALPSLDFSATQAGTYQLAYQFAQGGGELTAGFQAFDREGAAILGLSLAHPYELPTRPVTVSVALQSAAAPVTLNLFLDGQLVAERTIAGEGYQVETFALGTLPLGSYTLTASSLDSAGHDSQAAVELQVRQPGLQVAVVPAAGASGWHTVTPTVWLLPEIAESLVYYTWDGGPPQRAADHQAVIPPDGQHVLTAWAEVDGHRGPLATRSLWLDHQPPQVEVFIASGTPVTASLVLSDSASGVAWAGYWGASGWLTYTAPLTFVESQTTTLIVQARDGAGNQSAILQADVPPVEQPYAFDLSAAVSSLSGAPGGSVIYELTLTNLGAVADAYSVTVSSDGWTAHGPVQVGWLDPGRSASLFIGVDIPAGASPPASSLVTVSVASLGNPALTADHQLTTSSVVFYDVSLEAGNPSRSGAPGGEVVYRLRIANQGNFTDTFDLNAADHAWPVTVAGVVGPLGPGAYRTIEVVVSIPADVVPGEHDAALITAVSQGDPTRLQSLILTTQSDIPAGMSYITVSPLFLDVTLQPGEALTRALIIDNLGTEVLSWTLTSSAVPWLTAAPVSGLLGAAQQAEISLAFDGTDLAEGEYITTLQIASNDPYTPQIEIAIVVRVVRLDYRIYLPTISR